MKDNPRAHLALLGSTLLFGANYWIAKGLMPNYLLPLQIIFLRILGTFSLAWAIQMSIKEARHQKIDRKDMPRLIISALLGVAINQIMFFTGLNHTTPVDAAIINSVNPMLVLVFAALLLSEKISGSKVIGLILGASGALLLILFGNPAGLHGGGIRGNLFILINTTAWSLYLVISKPLMMKYNPLILMRWIFMIGLIAVLPFTISQALDIDFSGFTGYTWFSIGYIILGTTFLAYFGITYSLKRLSPPVVAYYSYLQPVFVALIGILMFVEKISWIKIISALLVFVGIYFVIKKKED